MSALNHLTEIRHHRVHTTGRSQTAGYQPGVVATTLTIDETLDHAQRAGWLRASAA